MFFISALTVLAVVVHGYHPYAEDGGLYVAGVKWLIDPVLYPHQTSFVTEHLRFSLFAPAVALMVRVSHLGLGAVLFLLYVASFWATLFGAWLLARRCFVARTAQCGAVALLAVWLTMPIAGTALMLMDPYVTARSISTPCALLVLEGSLMLFFTQGEERVRGLVFTASALAVAAAMHPLMAADALGCSLVLGFLSSSSQRIRLWGTLSLCTAATVTAGFLYKLAPVEGSLYRQAAVTRFYWFLSQWHWYELLGLAAPLAILAVVAFRSQRDGNAAKTALTRMTLAVGATAIVIAALFARVGATNYSVARLQPLRVFQLVYVVMILMLGAAGARHFLGRRPIRWLTSLALLCGMVAFFDIQTFPNSAHIELSSELNSTHNQWKQAFLWIRQNTPNDALFALDANYIVKPGEDAQCFRALAERSALPDYSKDGGEASITPALAPAWALGQTVQDRLNTETDADRIAALVPLGVTWIVLEKNASTGFACGFQNSKVKVCRLPQEVADKRLR